jgi:predicted TIM-barrel fold metal-dependent hydrolase
MAQIIDQLGSDDLLMFSTDYPHEHTDTIAQLLEVMPVAMRPRMMAETARDLYSL